MPPKKHVVLDAVALFQLQKSSPPNVLKKLQQEIINGKIIAIIPTISITEILWKFRKDGENALQALRENYLRWKESPNIIIDSFDMSILNQMMDNEKSYELHDEIIAMTCHKYNTKNIYSTDKKFKDFWSLTLISW